MVGNICFGNWSRVKIGSKLGRNWVKIGSKSGQNRVQIRSKLGQNRVKIGSRRYNGANRQHHRINETISFARVFFSRLWVEIIFRTTNLCHFFKKSYVIFIVWPIFFFIECFYSSVISHVNFLFHVIMSFFTFSSDIFLFRIYRINLEFWLNRS